MKSQLLRLSILFIALLFYPGCNLIKSIAPGDEAPVKKTENRYYNYIEAYLHIKKNNLDKAIYYLTKTIKDDRENLYLQRELAIFYLMQKDNLNALNIVENIIDKNPDDIEALIMYGRIKQSLEQIDDAKQAYEKVIASDPAQEKVYLLLGGIYMEEGDLVKALKIYKQLVDKYPEFYAGYFFIGKIYAEQGKIVDAEKEFLKALDLEPDLEEAGFELIELYKGIGEERELAIRVREHGDKEAAYILATSNLRLVVKIALEFQRIWMQNLLDLIQEGNMGLMQAVRKFDPYKNVKFSYYSSFWIKAYILKFIMDNWRLVKIGTTQGQRKLFFKLKKEKQRLIDEGFDPKPKLLSQTLGVSEREVVDMEQRLNGWDVSLDAPLKDDSDTERIEFLSTEDESIEEKVAKKEIEELLHNKIEMFKKKMNKRELEIFNARIFSDDPATLQEIGDRYGISRERVRQIEKSLIKKLREFFKREVSDFDSYAFKDEVE